MSILHQRWGHFAHSCLCIAAHLPLYTVVIIQFQCDPFKTFSSAISQTTKAHDHNGLINLVLMQWAYVLFTKHRRGRNFYGEIFVALPYANIGDVKTSDSWTFLFFLLFNFLALVRSDIVWYRCGVVFFHNRSQIQWLYVWLKWRKSCCLPKKSQTLTVRHVSSWHCFTLWPPLNIRAKAKRQKKQTNNTF